jgi:hypothetical protein
VARVQQPDPGTPRERANREQIGLITPLPARYDLTVTSGTGFTVTPARTWKGTDRLILPFHEWQPADTTGSPLVRECPGGDIATGATGIGGVVDGTGAVTAGQYLLWGFLSARGGNFLGYGLTRKPDHAGTVTAGGGLGVPITVTFTTATRGNCYTVGSRVIIRAGTGVTSLYNQGTVTAVSSTTLQATMDAAYAVTYAPSANTVLPVATAVSVIQTDLLAPWVSQATQGTYRETPFTYLGSVEIDATRTIYLRKPGDPVWASVPFTTITVAGGASVNVVSLRRWIGRHVRHAYLEGDVLRTGGPGGANTLLTLDTVASYGQLQTSSTNAATIQGKASDMLSVAPLYSSVRATVTINGATTVTATAFLRGWVDEAY